MRRPNEDLSYFSCGDECVLVVLEDSREENRELVLHHVCHADTNGKIYSLNLFSEGGGAQCWPKVDQFPRRRRDTSAYRTKAAEWKAREKNTIEWLTTRRLRRY